MSEPIRTQAELEAALAKDFAALRERDAIRRNIAADPLPGPAARAFAGEPLVVHGFTIRPCRGGDVILLRRLNSPLIRRTKEIVEHFRKVAAQELPLDAEMTPTSYEDEEAVEMVYQFVRPIEEVRAVLDRGRAEFRETALRLVADQVNYTQLPDLIAAVEASYQASFETFQKYTPKGKEGEQVRNFSTPPAPPATG
jgi:hypothetical protein